MIARLFRRRPRIDALRQAEEEARQAYFTACRKHQPSVHLHRKWAIAKAKRITAEVR